MHAAELLQIGAQTKIRTIIGLEAFEASRRIPHLAEMYASDTDGDRAKLNVILSLLLRPDRSIFLFDEAVTRRALKVCLAPFKVTLVQGAMLPLSSFVIMFKPLRQEEILMTLASAVMRIQTDHYIPEKYLYSLIEEVPHFHALLLFAMAIAFQQKTIYGVFLNDLIRCDIMSTPDDFYTDVKFIGPPYFLDVLTDYGSRSTGDFNRMLNKAYSGSKNCVPVVSSKKLQQRYLANRAMYHQNIAARTERVVRRVQSLVAREEREHEELRRKQDKEQLREECCICLDSPSTVEFLPCGHVSSCAECSIHLEVCMLCRTIIVCKKPASADQVEQVQEQDDDDDEECVAPYKFHKPINAKIRQKNRRRSRRSA